MILCGPVWLGLPEKRGDKMKKQVSLFKRAKVLDTKFKTFLMNITTAGVVFGEATEVFLKKQADRSFLKLKDKIQSLESENDMLRRDIEAALYRQMILPGMRSDLLDLMEGCDHVINQYEHVVLMWMVEQTKVPVDLFDEIMTLVATTQNCVGALMTGSKAFFDGQMSVENEVQECYYLEHAIDLQALQLKDKIFHKKIPLARQLQLKEFVTTLEKISDLAEDAADKLKIISVKHAL